MPHKMHPAFVINPTHFGAGLITARFIIVERYFMSDLNSPPEENPTSFGVAKILIVLFIGVTAVMAILALFGFFAWLTLWKLLFKIAIAAAIVIAAVFIIGFLIQGKK
jgi:hypothetical protein